MSEYPVVLESFMKRSIILSPLNCLGILVESQLYILYFVLQSQVVTFQLDLIILILSKCTVEDKQTNKKNPLNDREPTADYQRGGGGKMGEMGKGD